MDNICEMFFQTTKWDQKDLRKEFMCQYVHLRMAYNNMSPVSFLSPTYVYFVANYKNQML